MPFIPLAFAGGGAKKIVDDAEDDKKSLLEFIDDKQVFPAQSKSPIEDKDTRFSDE